MIHFVLPVRDAGGVPTLCMCLGSSKNNIGEYQCLLFTRDGSWLERHGEEELPAPGLWTALQRMAFSTVLGTLAESVLLQVGQRLEIDFTL